MKKTIISFLFSLITIVGFSQFGNNTPLGGSNSNTRQTSAGGLSIAKMMQIPIFVDTLSAYNGQTETYIASIIFTTSDNKYWVRNSTITKWLQVNGGSGSGSVDSVVSVKQGCLDIQKYWIGGIAVAFDTIQVYDGIVNSGSITEISSNNFNVIPYSYRIGCSEYKTPAADTVLIIPSFDTLPRYFVVGGNTNNQAVLVRGEESENPTPPPVSSTQLALGYIYQTSTGNTIVPVPTNFDSLFLHRYKRDTIYVGAKIDLDTFRMQFHVPSDVFSPATPASPPFIMGTIAPDTITQVAIAVGFKEYVKATTPGNTNPKFAKFTESLNSGLVTSTENNDGSFGMPAAGFNFIPTRKIQTAGTIRIQAVGTGAVDTSALIIENIIQSISARSNYVQIKPGAGYAGVRAKALSIIANAGDSVFSVHNNGNIGLGNNAYLSTAQILVNGINKGVILNRMTTVQRDGMDNIAVSTNISVGGSGLIRPPVITSPSTGGKRPVYTAVISGGVLIGITINDSGSIVTNASLTIDTTNCTVGVGNVLPVATMTAGTTVIGYGTIICNTDSSSCPYESYNGSSWISMCGGSGGGGSVGTLQQVLTAGSTLTTSNNFIDPDVNTKNLFFGNITPFNTFEIDADDILLAGTTNAAIQAPNVTIGQSSGSVVKISGIVAQHNADDSILVRKASNGNIGFRAFPAGSTTPNIQQVLTQGSQVNTDNDISPDTNDAYDFTIGNNARFNTLGLYSNNIVLTGLADIQLGAPETRLQSPSVKMTAITAQHNADDSMLVRKASDGSVGYRSITTSTGVSSIATTSPITGGTITTTGTIACPTCVVAAVNPSAGVAHFAGSTQTTTSSLIVNADITNSTINLTTKVTGTLPIANGGTNITTYTTGDILYASASNVLSKLPIGSTNDVLTVSGGVPTWSVGSSPVGDTLIGFGGIVVRPGPTSGQDSIVMKHVPGSIVFAGTDSITDGTANATIDASGNASFAGDITNHSVLSLTQFISDVDFTAIAGTSYTLDDSNSGSHTISFSSLREGDQFVFINGESNPTRPFVLSSSVVLPDLSSFTILEAFTTYSIIYSNGSLRLLSSQISPSLFSGVYTPTVTNGTNTTASGGRMSHYSRVGNEVTVFFDIVTTTTLAVASTVTIQLPIASTLGTDTDLQGIGVGQTAIALNATLSSDTAGAALLSFTGTSVSGTGHIKGSFMYTIN